MVKQKCKRCKNNFNILCKDGNCYYCFTEEYGRSPTIEYGNKFTNQNK